MRDRIAFLYNRLREKLWVRPLVMCVLSIAAAFLAKIADASALGDVVPEVKVESIDTLLTVLSASMLVIATFAVASMVSAYASASGTATPRSFTLVVADDVSQNALSAFIGAFIFSIVALVALQNGYYATAGRFTLFALTILVFVGVILTFVRWVDRVARLGRLGTTITKVEVAARDALQRRARAPRLGGVAPGPRPSGAIAVYAESIGYVERVDLLALQTLADASNLHIEVSALPGAFTAPGKVLAYVTEDGQAPSDFDPSAIAGAFAIGDSRTFDDDPRFGLIVLSEIASRALSPGINDPGTAIDVIGRFVRLFAEWGKLRPPEDAEPLRYDRVAVPELDLDDLFDDAFSATARDGAGTIEVVIRLQKAFASIASIDNPALRSAALHHARLALLRAQQALTFEADLEAAQAAAPVRSGAV